MERRRNGRASIAAGSSSSSSLGGCGVTQTCAARAMAGLLSFYRLIKVQGSGGQAAAVGWVTLELVLV